MRKCLILISTSILCIITMAVTGFAQVDTGRIVGTVRDASGGVVPGATITATEVNTAIKTTVQTDASGNYVIAPLKIGNYSLTAHARGFKTMRRTGIVLNVMAGVRVDFTLQVGSVTQTVEVSGAPSLVQTTNASLGNVVNTQEIEEMPLNGRQYLDLATLTAGAIVVSASNPARGSYDGQGNFSVDGTRNDQNDYILDGIQNNSNDNGGMTVQSSPDAIAEFKIQTTNYSAEFGRSAGGVVNATTKSGTNGFHGELFEFLRNQALDARNFFLPPGPIAPYKLNQFGGTIGGPIKKDKMFFFVDYQGTRIDETHTYVETVPTLEERTGNFSGILGPQTGVDALGRPIYQNEIYDPSTTQTVNGTIVRNGLGFDPTTGLPTGAANIIPAGDINTLAKNAIALYPLPTLSNVTAQNFVEDEPDTHQGDQFDVRVDENLSSKTEMFGRYSFDRELTDLAPPFPGIADGGGYSSGTEPLRGQGGVFGLTQIISPTKVNSLRIGFNRVNYIVDKPPGGQVYPPADLAIPGQPNSSLINGLAWFGPSGYAGLGEPTDTPTYDTSQQFVLNDTFTWVHGNHTILMGPQLEDDQFNLLQIGQPRGNLSFAGLFTSIDPGNTQGTGNGLADMFLGLPQDAVISTVTYFGNRQKTYGGFVQDTYKVRPSLTLDLGLRYDYVTPLGEAHNRISNFWYPTGTIIPAGTPGYPSNLEVLKKDNFAPRVGLAYDLSRSHNWVIRAAYGRFFTFNEIRTGDPLQLAFNLPFFYEPDFVSNGVTPNFTLATGWPALNPANAPLPGVTSEQWYPDTPVVDEWNLDVEHQLPGQVMLTAAYVGNKGTHQQVTDDFNQALTPGPTFSQSELPYPQYGPFTSIENEGNSTYESFQLTAEKRMGQGLYFMSAFTWGKAIDDQPLIGLVCDPWPNNSYDIRAEKGLSEFDVLYNSVTSFDYALPVGEGQKFLSQNKGLDYVLGGWHVGGIVTFSTGLPFTPTMGYDPTNTESLGAMRTDRIGNGTLPNPTPNLWFNINDFPVPTCYCFGNAGKDILEGPSTANADLALRKFFNFTERYRLEFRAEFFNAFNTTNLSAPDPYITDGPGEAGVITSTNIANREIQFALKLHF